MTNLNKFAPEGGWKRHTYYVVAVQLSKNNVEHRTIFYVGFLNGPEKSPGAYSTLLNPAYADKIPLSKIHKMKVISKIEGIGDGYV